MAWCEGWLRISEEERTPIQFETHRNCITNDLYTTVQLLDAIPAMRLAADLSHYVVDRELPCPPTPPLESLIARILAR
jgi:sugar phosphate isomerase/epimerase